MIFDEQKQVKDRINKLITMPKGDEQNKKDKSAQPKKSLKPIPSKLINFTPLLETQSKQSRYYQRIERNNFQSNQLNKKINKMLRLSFIPSNKSGQSLNRTTQRADMSLGEVIKLDRDVRKQQIFSIPKIIKTINAKLSQYSQNDTEAHPSSHQKLFMQQQEYLHVLHNKTKFSTTKGRNDLKADKDIQPLESMNMLQQSLNRDSENVKKFQRTSKNQPFSYRSKTMHVETQNQPEKSFSFSCKKVPIELEEQMMKKELKNANKFYERFQTYWRLTHNEKSTVSNKQFIPNNITTCKNSEKSSSRKTSTRQLKLTQINKPYQPQFRNHKDKYLRDQNIKETIRKQLQLSQSPSHQSNLIGQNKTSFKVMIKSNSNNKGFGGQRILSGEKRVSFHESKQSRDLKKRIINFRPQESFSSPKIKFINLTSYNQKNDNSEDNNDGNLSRNAERIHYPSSEKIEMSRTNSRKSTKKSRYLHFERNMKLSNNIHIVITQNNKTKINIFHNSLLLKQDPQKMDALTRLVREASRNDHSQGKIQVPLELGINKLKIEQKNNQLSGRESRKEIQTQLREGMKKDKQKRKHSVPRTRTQKKYQFVLEDVKPWQISDQRDIQQSHHTSLNDNQFTYLNSKTIT